MPPMWRLQLMLLVGWACAFTVDGKDMTVSLFEGEDNVKDIKISASQRCHTFSCFPGMMTRVSWENIPSSTAIAVYQGKQCKGEYATSPTSSESISTGDNRLKNRIASVMVLEDGLYPTRGIVDVCPKENAIFFNNSTDGSGGLPIVSDTASLDNKSIVGNLSEGEEGAKP